MALLTVKNLSFTYATEQGEALHDISFDIENGEFIVLCGATGCGKSTLLRLLKRELSPMGEKTGEIFFDGKPLEGLSAKDSASLIGYVMQQPEEQIVTDKVWHELAFGLENQNVPQGVIRRRVAEMASYFGIEDWFLSDVSALSGGQKQLLNLASVMVMQPRLLLLDEPTAQLDPITASDFIATLKKLNRELGLTILLIEHRLEEVIPLCDRLMVMENGALLAMDTPKKAVAQLREHPSLFWGMPLAVRLSHKLGYEGDAPLDIREGRMFLEKNYGNTLRTVPEIPYEPAKEKALSFRHVYFRYEKNGEDILTDLDFDVYENEIFCILGGNGSGKTTTLSIASGLFTPYHGDVRVFGKKIKDYKNGTLYKECLALLPQDVQTVFLRNTVREELFDAGVDISALPYDLSPLLHRHPYDVSGGERQLVALAKVLAGKPRLLLLDEPTKGLDASAKARVIGILKDLKASGVTIVAVTHDVEFAAGLADRTALFFRGSIVCAETPRRFFAENHFYTTSASRMTRGYYENAVTEEDILFLCEQNGRKR